MVNISEEFEKVKVALAKPASRQKFLAEWFISEAGRVIGQSPTLRGRFAGDTGMTQDELEEWGNNYIRPGRS